MGKLSAEWQPYVDQLESRLKAAEQRDVDAVYWEKEWIKANTMIKEIRTREKATIQAISELPRFDNEKNGMRERTGGRWIDGYKFQAIIGSRE